MAEEGFLTKNMRKRPRRFCRELSWLTCSLFAALHAHEARADEARSVVESGKVDGLSVASALTRRDDDARRLDPPAEEGLLRLLGHGELQVRGVGMADLALDRSPTYAAAHPNASSESLGQRVFGTQWLRLRPTLQIGRNVKIVAQADVFGGIVLGDLTRDVSGDGHPRDAFDSIGNAELRWAFLEWLTPIGLVRVGRQPSHWGLGMVANDGDHRPRFGDYRKGSTGDRVLFATKPLGESSPLVVALAGDLVRRDTFANENRGDATMQGVAAILWQGERLEAGVYGALRRQTNDRTSVPNVAFYTDSLRALVGDAYVRTTSPLVGDVEVVAGAEVAVLTAQSDVPRTAEALRRGQRTTIAGLGVLAEFTIQGGRLEQKGLRPRPRWSATLEYGFASGQADPFASTQTRFSFDTNHRVGLVLFDEVLRWQTARAATAIQDPYLAAQSRPVPGVDLLPTSGSVTGASYMQPSFTYRPTASLDLTVGVLVAQSTADVVDPYRLAVDGTYANYVGGAPRGRDFGVEVDAAIEKRWVSEAGLVPQLGVQAGVLFPGTAFADAKGNTMPSPWLVQGRAGLQF